MFGVLIATRTELVALLGSPHGRLDRVRWRHNPTGKETEKPIRNVFVFIGADPANALAEGLRRLARQKRFRAHGAIACAGRTRNECPAADATRVQHIRRVCGRRRALRLSQAGWRSNRRRRGRGAGTALLLGGYTGCTAVRPRGTAQLRNALLAKRVACGGGPVERGDGSSMRGHEPASRHAARA